MPDREATSAKPAVETQAGSESSSRTYYDDFSKRYDAARHLGYHRLIDDLEMQAVAPFARDRRVLEAGCGTGLILQRLSSIAQHACGFDLSAGMVQKARDRGLDVVLGSVTHIPFGDATFDLVCSFKVLAHVPQIDRALQELVRVTRPGGHLALEFYNPWSLRYLAKRLTGPRPISEQRQEDDVFTRWDTPREIVHKLPSDVDVVGYRGVRVLTPAAVFHRVPFVAPVLQWAEQAAVTSPLRFFGGFLVVLLRKRPL